MDFTKHRRAPLGLGMALAFLCSAATAVTLQSEDQQRPLGSRTTPLCAMNKDGTPATGLTAADLEVLVDGNLSLLVFDEAGDVSSSQKLV